MFECINRNNLHINELVLESLKRINELKYKNVKHTSYRSKLLCYCLEYNDIINLKDWLRLYYIYNNAIDDNEIIYTNAKKLENDFIDKIETNGNNIIYDKKSDSVYIILNSVNGVLYEKELKKIYNNPEATNVYIIFFDKDIIFCSYCHKNITFFNDSRIVFKGLIKNYKKFLKTFLNSNDIFN